MIDAPDRVLKVFNIKSHDQDHICTEGRTEPHQNKERAKYREID